MSVDIEQCIQLLCDLIDQPSLSREEDKTAQILINFFTQLDIDVEKIGHNIIAKNRYWDEGKIILLLNSHHDTVKPAKTYTRDPYKSSIENGQLFGLGSNDAGGPLVTLIHLFLSYYDRKDLPFNILMVASAEEEISGKNGIALVLQTYTNIWAGIVGEPTLMEAAVAERGLMVVDGISEGISGHAARKEGVNALYKGIEAIGEIRKIDFDKKSDYLPDTQAIVTQIQSGTQHNVIPDHCSFVIDVRVNECYNNREVFEILQSNCSAQLTARSYRLNSSFLPLSHPLHRTIKSLGWKTYGSPTLSDQALMSFPTLKLGPGDSARSHTADEYIYVDEIIEGSKLYHLFLENLIKEMQHE
ncbi:M20/M25/M40 family metallo-hydrolase [Membranihabitans marinus]|uniref:M20/M25/M40 family metallo-hydrolase n=1 Tax=Membranihabitans marinus TaxID=1227546 RepID=UPI001F32EB23|nr:M20/M25/M40 family metallo-hydrolase [Membranihabitans marinus]